MTESPKQFQFTISRIMHATAWLGATSAFVAAALRNYGESDALLPCFSFCVILTLGLSVGGLLGKPLIQTAGIVLVILLVLLVLSAFFLPAVQ